MVNATQEGDRYRAITAQAWSGMLAIVLAMLIADVDRLAMQGSYEDLSHSLADDPGFRGLWVLVGLICLNALLQVAIRTIDTRNFRRTVFWVSVAYTAFFVIHQAVHIWSGERFTLHTILDVTHHALGVWACWASSQWLKAAA